MENQYKTASEKEKSLKLEIDNLIGEGFKLMDVSNNVSVKYGKNFSEDDIRDLYRHITSGGDVDIDINYIKRDGITSRNILERKEAIKRRNEKQMNKMLRNGKSVEEAEKYMLECFRTKMIDNLKEKWGEREMSEICKTCSKEFNFGIWMSPQFRDEKVLLFCSKKCKKEYVGMKLNIIKVNYPKYYEKIIKFYKKNGFYDFNLKEVKK